MTTLTKDVMFELCYTANVAVLVPLVFNLKQEFLFAQWNTSSYFQPMYSLNYILTENF